VWTRGPCQRLGHKSRFHFKLFQPAQQGGCGAGLEFQRDLGVAGMEGREHRGQARTRRTLQRAQAQHTTHRAALQLLFGLVRHLQQLVGMAEQGAAGIGQHQAAALAAEQCLTQAFLELLDAGGDVGWHTVEQGGRARDTAFPHHAAEDVQIVQIHLSHLEKYMFQ
jgi:hypothetical protein